MPTLETIARNAACNGIVDLLDTGDIRLETGANAEVALNTFGNPAFGASVAGVATANAIADDTSAAGGIVDHALLRNSGSATVLTATTGLVASGADIELSSLTIGVGDTVSFSAFTATMPAS